MPSDHIHIREEQLPGVGRRYDLDVAEGRTLSVVAGGDGSRQLAIRHRGADEPHGQVQLRREEAVAVGSLLLGVRFSDSSQDTPGSSVDVSIVVLGDTSPAVGRRPAEIAMPDDAEGAVLAVVRDDTPQLLEDRSRPCEPGDRLVVAARRDRLDALLDHLAG